MCVMVHGILGSGHKQVTSIETLGLEVVVVVEEEVRVGNLCVNLANTSLACMQHYFIHSSRTLPTHVRGLVLTHPGIRPD